MATPADLHQRLGPVLYARAMRVVKDQKLAERLSRDAIDALKAEPGEDDATLLKRARENLRELCALHVPEPMDSLLPGFGGTGSKPKPR